MSALNSNNNPIKNKGGRPSDPIWEHFNKTDKRKNNFICYAQCKHCAKAHEENPQDIPEQPLVSGRKDAMTVHLEKCRFAKKFRTDNEAADADASSTAAASGQLSIPSSSSASSSITGYLQSMVGSNKKDDGRTRHQRSMYGYVCPPFSPKQVDKFQELCLQLTADLNLPFHWIEKQSAKRFVEFLNPVAVEHMPGRKLLSSDILDRFSHCSDAAVKEKLLRQQKRGGRVNLITDAWENSARRHVLGAMFSLFGVIWTYGVSECTIRQDGLAVAEAIEDIIMKSICNGWEIGAVITDNAGQCARARRILSLRWPQIVFLFCFAHQVNLLVKDVLRRAFGVVAAEAAAIINTLSRSTSKWLPSLRSYMSKLYGKQYGIYRIADTRWNSAQSSFASLLRVRTAVKVFIITHKSEPGFPSSFLPAESEEFWTHLAAAEEAIRPLTYASFLLQSDDCNLADVVDVFGRIYKGFSVTGDEVLVNCIKERWAACEQPLYLIAYLLHPKYAADVRKITRNSQTLSISFFVELTVFYYKRLISENIGLLRDQIFKWIKGTLVDDIDIDPLVDFRNHHSFWEFVKDAYHCEIGSLAMVVLSVAVNSATCERLFSEWGYIHSARRNRMNPQKTKKLGVIRATVRELDRKEAREATKESNNNQGEKERDPVSRIVDSTEMSRVDGEANGDRGTEELHITFFESDSGDSSSSEEESSDVEAAGGDANNMNGEDDDTSPSGASAMFSGWAAIIREGCGDDDDEMRNGGGEFSSGSLSGTTTTTTRSTTAPRRPFPSFNDPNFPQESHLGGIRGTKVELSVLFDE